jgi:hypothetical protein
MTYRPLRNDWIVITGTGHPEDFHLRLTRNDIVTDNSCRMQNTGGGVVRDGDKATLRLSFLYVDGHIGTIQEHCKVYVSHQAQPVYCTSCTQFRLVKCER